MKILGIIPARGGSKGVPNKNIKELNGKPLIQYTAEVALQSKLLDRVVVSTDDQDIADVSRSLGLDVPFMRPSDLAADKTPTLPVIIHALNFFKEQDIHFDAVCLLQVTSPLRTLKFLDDCIQHFINKGTDSLISVLEVPHKYNPHWVFLKDENKNLKIATGDTNIISRRQDLPKAFLRDGSIYITKADTILNKKSLYGDSISYLENPTKIEVNIDTMEDWIIAEEVMKRMEL